MAAAAGDPFIIAVDAGGTHTRVGCFGIDGSLLSSVSGSGGSPYHNHDSAENVAAALADCLERGELDAADAVGLAAGMAAISRPGSNQGDGSNEWADAYFSLSSLTCPRIIVNDAVAAHRGALLGEPGVIVVAGTGSMIMAVTDRGVEVESGQFEHYAGGARHLVFEAMELILTGVGTADDAGFIATVLDYWGAGTLSELRDVILGLAAIDRAEVRRLYGRLAPAVTAAADTSPLADRALRELTAKTARGVFLLAPLVGAGRDRRAGPVPVPVVTAGALATDARFTARLAQELAAESPESRQNLQRAVLVPTALDPLRGAALLAYEAAGVPISHSLVRRLSEHR